MTTKTKTVTISAFEGDRHPVTFTISEYSGYGMRQISVKSEVSGYAVLLTRFEGSRLWAIRGGFKPECAEYKDRHGNATRARALDIAFSLIRFGYA